MNNSYAIELGNNLKGVRLKKNFTQIEVAEKAEINSNYYAKVERGEVKVSMELVSKIAKVLGVKLEEIKPS